MTRIVVVDDIKVFPFPRTADIEVLYCRTLDEGLRTVFDGEPIEQLWLDYSLGTGPRGQPEDIEPLVRHLVECAVAGNKVDIGLVVVCTGVPGGYEAISGALSPYYSIERVVDAFDAKRLISLTHDPYFKG